MTIMSKNASEYGLTDVMPDAPLTYDTIEVTAPTHLALVADLTDAPMSELLELNPAVLKNVVPAGYKLHVPSGTGATLSASLESIPTGQRLSCRSHKVLSGETLASIGKHYGAQAAAIAVVNGLGMAVPSTGDRILIPVNYKEPSSARHPAAAQARRRKGSLPIVSHSASLRPLRYPRNAGGQ
jgi:membrane-bound lytic murein transglycosylase D